MAKNVAMMKNMFSSQHSPGGAACGAPAAKGEAGGNDRDEPTLPDFHGRRTFLFEARTGRSLPSPADSDVTSQHPWIHRMFLDGSFWGCFVTTALDGKFSWAIHMLL